MFSLKFKKWYNNWPASGESISFDSFEAAKNEGIKLFQDLMGQYDNNGCQVAVSDSSIL